MIPVCEPYLMGNEQKYVDECLESNWVSSGGKFISAFEKAFAEYCGCKYGVSTTSGTTALHLALASLGIKEGDEVIVPTFTMAASAFAVCYTGAKPIFVDCESYTFNIDPEKIEEKITAHTKAIMPVHIYGHPCNMQPILDIANKYDLFIIEDAAEAHGATYNSSRVGSISNIGCFSFYANKIITTGEGGMVVTNDKQIADKARSLKDLAHTSTRFLHSDIGFNYRMTNIQAAIGLAQLENIEEYIGRRHKHALLYNKLLDGTEGITLPLEMSWAKNVYWMYGLLVNKNRQELIEYLKEKEIETRNFFIPMHQQPMFKEERPNYPVADFISSHGLYLPSGTGLKNEEIEYICNTIKEFLA